MTKDRVNSKVWAIDRAAADAGTYSLFEYDHAGRAFLVYRMPGPSMGKPSPRRVDVGPSPLGCTAARLGLPVWVRVLMLDWNEEQDRYVLRASRSYWRPASVVRAVRAHLAGE